MKDMLYPPAARAAAKASVQEPPPATTAQEAMHWFSSFYVTPCMLEKGFVARHPAGEPEAHRGAYSEPGEPYDYEAVCERYRRERAEETEHLEGRQKQLATKGQTMCDSEWISRVRGALKPAAFSFVSGPLSDYEQMEQIEKFDDTTLLRIAVAHTDPWTEREIKRSALLEIVHAVVLSEYEKAETGLEHHPVLELMCGVLCLGNWKWLSGADLTKWAVAHGASDHYLDRDVDDDDRDTLVNAVLDSQIGMLVEAVKNGPTEVMRGHDRIRELLADNRSRRGLCDEEPEDDDDEATKGIHYDRDSGVEAKDEDESDKKRPGAADDDPDRPTKKRARTNE